MLPALARKNPHPKQQQITRRKDNARATERLAFTPPFFLVQRRSIGGSTLETKAAAGVGKDAKAGKETNTRNKKATTRQGPCRHKQKPHEVAGGETLDPRAPSSSSSPPVYPFVFAYCSFSFVLHLPSHHFLSFPPFFFLFNFHSSIASSRAAREKRTCRRVSQAESPIL